MRRPTSLLRAFSGALFGLAIGVVPALAATPFFATGTYVITLRGVNVAEAEIGFSDDGETYRVAVNGNVAGVATLVARGTATLSSAGRSRADGLQSESFSLTTRTEFENFYLGYEASGGRVTSEMINPPLPADVERVPLASAHRRGVNDPIAAFLLRASDLDPEACNRTLHVFTGIERYDMELAFLDRQEATSQRTGYQGPVMLCSIRYRPISGHFVNSPSTEYLAQSDRFLIWYAPLGTTGFLFPYRMIMGTAYGDLSMILTRLTGI